MSFTIKDSIPYILITLVVASVTGSVAYIGMSSGNSDSRNEIQKHVSILLVVNLLTCLFMGFLLYYYVTSNPSSFIPFTIFILTFNMFLGIMATSVSVLQQVS